ncbi:hypothetical protein G4B88_017806 [Cannabis sativa]|uniref:sucrose synthase n=1 Tax=Cannabis sativa TaxID=3483 RepID=A0A7J6DS52_CANSA|nr:hypothetical protein G4B88_017806 [Cannabis sativa]
MNYLKTTTCMEVRVIAAQTNRARNGELYRYIPDTRGATFYEAFGLTVVEAMTCGLPTFATCHGGLAEIIEHGLSVKEDISNWNKISNGRLQRIYDRYTWKIYSERLMTLAGIYGFWKYVSKLF